MAPSRVEQVLIVTDRRRAEAALRESEEGLARARLDQLHLGDRRTSALFPLSAPPVPR